MPPVFPTPPTSTAEPPPLQTLYPPASWSRLALDLNTALDQLRAAHAEIEELRSKCDQQAFEIEELRAKNFDTHAVYSAELTKARQVTEQLYDKFRRVQTQLEQLTPGLLPAFMAERAARQHLQEQLADLQASSSEALRRNQEYYEEKRATHERQLREMRGLSHSQLVENEVLRRQIEELRTKLEAAEIARDEALEDRTLLIRKEAEHLQHQREAARQLFKALNAVDDHLRDAQSAAVQLT